MKDQRIIGETQFTINGQTYSMEQIGEQKARELIRKKVDQAMEGIGFERLCKEKQREKEKLFEKNMESSEFGQSVRNSLIGN